ncbi:hypothetical protein [Symbioplanes lichenis]|uniref:hypothetical protein n=1 Tax=Symbioplanes lichenis TaxID=1629072 RepID=UPI0027388866|nr:hypothetical protein [Actinoplanes lichenis]
MRKLGTNMAIASATVLVAYFAIQFTPGNKIDTSREYLGLLVFLAIAIAIFVTMDWLTDRRLPSKQAQIRTPRLEQQLSELADVIRNGSEIMNRVEAELRLRERHAQELERRTRTLSEVAKLREDEAKIVGEFLTDQLHAKLADMDRSSRRTSWIAFGMGLVMSIPIGLFVNAVSQ